MLLYRLSCLLLCVAAQGACKRDRIPPPQSPDTLLKSIEWKDGGRENWSYDEQGNLAWTHGTSPSSAGIHGDFLYEERTLHLVQKPSIREDTFYFGNAGRIVRIEEYDMGLRREGGARLDFTYDGSGKVGQLVHIATQPAGKPEEYLYDLLPDERGYIFSPWAFVHRYQLAASQYEIWNVPVLQCMDRLPSRIVWTKKVNGQAADQASWEFEQKADRFGRLQRRTGGNGDWMQFNY